MKRYALIALAIAGALILAIIVIGLLIPIKHRASREATYNRPAAEIFRVITTPADFPAWRTGISKVDILPVRDGKPGWREFGKDGELPLEVERSVADTTLVTRISDRSLPFGGTWTYTLLSKGDSTTLRIVEDGEIYSPIFRFAARFFIGYTATIDQYLRDLGRHLGKKDVVIRASEAE